MPPVLWLALHERATFSIRNVTRNAVSSNIALCKRAAISANEEWWFFKPFWCNYRLSFTQTYGSLVIIRKWVDIKLPIVVWQSSSNVSNRPVRIGMSFKWQAWRRLIANLSIELYLTLRLLLIGFSFLLFSMLRRWVYRALLCRLLRWPMGWLWWPAMVVICEGMPLMAIFEETSGLRNTHVAYKI